MKSFLQSPEWMEFQKSLGREAFQVGETYVIKNPLPFGKNYLYAPRVDAYVDLQALAKQEKSIFVKVEPMQDDIAQQFVKSGYVKSSKNIQPHKTIILDLTLSEEELLGTFHPKTRYNIRVAEKHGVQVSRSMEHEVFWKLMEKTTQRDQFSSHPREYYEKLLKFCELYIAYKDSAPVAAAIILKHGDTAYYLHGASDHEYRAMMAPYALHWNILLNLKPLNLQRYDLWGIDAQKWPGVTRFKLGWGGRQVEYPGAFDLVISPLWYVAYSLYQKIRAR